MDEIDRNILRELHRDAELTNKALARRMGIAESTSFTVFGPCVSGA
ncbi:AsnC family transcriptional regulator [Rhodococcus sp. JS3073]|nr:AsnC family transcriptional regulator [Rhodococcus sp. JS3073]WAM19385.1 AsnC family transcriptional regulator [Rhodococcus sp. JS3073]